MTWLDLLDFNHTDLGLSWDMKFKTWDLHMCDPLLLQVVSSTSSLCSFLPHVGASSTCTCFHQVGFSIFTPSKLRETLFFAFCKNKIVSYSLSLFFVTTYLLLSSCRTNHGFAVGPEQLHSLFTVICTVSPITCWLLSSTISSSSFSRSASFSSTRLPAQK